MNSKKFGAFLRLLRTEKNLSTEQVASRFYVDEDTVTAWENGELLPKSDVLVEMSVYFDVDIRVLLSGGENNGSN